jgi:hypothetical protein
MSDLPASFYVREGASLRATVLARGPWNPAHQHGGPPSALLAGALARAEPEPGSFRLARVLVELLRPVPLDGALEVRVVAPRAGKQVQRMEASLLADGVEVARASGVRLRTEPLAVPANAEPEVPLPSPDTASTFHVPFFRLEPAYSNAMDIRIVEGRWGEPRVGAWGRARVPLVSGEETSGIERAMILADAESGIGPPLDPLAYGLVNPDLTVYFARLPEGEWVGLRVASYASADGVGLAESALFDRRGVFGRSAQSLLVRPIG